MDLSDFADQIARFVVENAAWVGPVAFALAFLESIAIFSVFVPAWAALLAIGALVGTEDAITFWPILIGGAAGAAISDWVSYWIGYLVGPRAFEIWPLRRHPAMRTRGEAFLQRWGVFAVFIGRFFGPLRAAVPLLAGIFGMPQVPFQIANVASAIVWAAVLILAGDVVGEALERIF